MDVNEHRPYRSLTQSRMGKEPRHLGPSMEAQSCRGQPPHRLHSEECVALPKKSYSSSETLKAYDQENRLLYDREEELSHQDRLARLWGREVTGGNSCVSSRANSVLTLTDTEHDNKSDNETGTPAFTHRSLNVCTQGRVARQWWSSPNGGGSKQKICLGAASLNSYISERDGK